MGSSKDTEASRLLQLRQKAMDELSGVEQEVLCSMVDKALEHGLTVRDIQLVIRYGLLERQHHAE